MITFGNKTKDGTPLLVVGLDQDDVARLTASPIWLDAARMAAAGLPPMELIILFGRTQGDILDMFRTRGVQINPDPTTGATP